MIDQEAVSFGLRNFDVMPAVGKNKEEVSAKKKDDYLFSATSIDMREKHANWKFFFSAVCDPVHRHCDGSRLCLPIEIRISPTHCGILLSSTTNMSPN